MVLAVAASRRPFLNGYGDHDEVPEGERVAIQQQIRDVAEAVDDIRGSVASIAIAQASMAGDIKVLTATQEGFESGIERRVAALEAGVTRDEWRAWAERLASAVAGAGAAQLAHTLLSK